MVERTPCSALIRTLRDGLIDTLSCRNGFPVTSPCEGAAGTPTCCNEALCAHLYSHCGGKPPEHMTS